MPTVAELILDLLAVRPRTGFEITRALEDEHRVLLRGREGAVYAALLQLERAGFVTSDVGVTTSGKERRLYSLPVLQDTRLPAEEAS
ncbi:MAG: helix-turn-helix transcriptional regulator [Planctomycetota bacterium]